MLTIVVLTFINTKKKQIIETCIHGSQWSIIFYTVNNMVDDV